MKFWVLAGIFSAAMTPAAFALTSADPACPADAERQAGAQQGDAVAVTPLSILKRAGTDTTTARNPIPEAERAAVRERQRLSRAPATATPLNVRPRKNTRPMQARIPDSVLIGGDGAL